jgi:hypothetical protein
MTSSKKIAVTKSSAAVDVAQKPVKIVAQPLDGRDALKALNGKKKIVDLPFAERDAIATKWEKNQKRAAKPETKRRVSNGNSRSPEARKARRIMRQFLFAQTVLADDTQDEETVAYYTARAAHLAELAGL